MKDRQQNSAAYPIPILLVSSADGRSPVVGVTPTVNLRKNVAAAASAAGSVTASDAAGVAYLNGIAADRDTLGTLVIEATAAGADPFVDVYRVVPWDPFDVGAALLAAKPAAQQAAGTLGREISPLRKWSGCITTGEYAAQGLSNGTDTGFNVRFPARFDRNSAVADVVVDFGGSYGVGDAPLPNAYTIAGLAIEWPAGTIAAVCTFGGQPSAVVTPGSVVSSDPAAVWLPPGAVAFIRIYGTVASGQYWPKGFTYGVYAINTAGYSHGTTQTDQTRNTAFAYATDFEYGFAPLKVRGRKANPAAISLAALGDSITFGSADNPFTGGGSDGGFISRAAVTAGIPLTRLGVPGELAANWGVNGPRAVCAGYDTHAITAWGINDYRSGRTAAQIEADMLRAWTSLAGRGVSTYQTTITPSSTSTDGWATLVNQTTHAANAVRTAVNDWLRDGAPIVSGAPAAAGSSATGTLRMGDAGHPAAGYIEVADAIESSRNSGKFAVSGGALTDDGIHPGVSAHALMAVPVLAVLTTLTQPATEAEAVWTYAGGAGRKATVRGYDAGQDPATLVLASTAADGTALSTLLEEIRAGSVGVSDVTDNGDGTYTVAFKKRDGSTTSVTRTFNPTTGDRT